MAIGEPAVYEHDLGNGMALTAYAVDPALDEGALEALVRSKDGKGELDLPKTSKHMKYVGTVEGFGDLNFEISDENYEVPDGLKPFREALGEKLDAARRADGSKPFKNGDIAVIDGPHGKNIKLCKGGYYDFKATELQAVPGDLVPGQYPAGKSVRELMPELGITNEQRARYLCFTFSMLPDNGFEFGFVQRAKDLGIAPDCMAMSGGTPGFDPDFFKQGFDFERFYMKSLTKQMEHEYKLDSSEWELTGVDLIDDRDTLPCMVTEIKTPVSTKEIAKRIYGNQRAINEHPFIYSVSTENESLRAVLQRFPIFEPCTYIMDVIDRNR